MKTCLAIILLLAAALPAQAAPSTESTIDWQPWSPALFERAQAEHKFVFLYLEAVWCHWCHVMQAKTFTDPAVQQALRSDYLVARVDHDADPLLANRYRDWGWPALIFLAPDGTEIVKRAGYIAPEPFLRLLKAIVADPSPETATTPATAPVSDNSTLPPALRQALRQSHRDSYDPELGGLKLAQKFLDRDSVEYALVRAAAGDADEAARARQTLDAARSLIDPVWGGMYQYSTGGVWSNPHYEKIMRTQAGALRIYALAWAQFQRRADLISAQAIRDYLLNFLRGPDGAFYVSQDADLVRGEKAHGYFVLNDAARRKRGMPRIDTHQYAQENGQAIEALAALAEYSGDTLAADAALAAAHWVIAERSLPGGGYAHGSDDAGGPYLGDSLAMSRAFLALYRVTADRQWLDRATESALFIDRSFRGSGGGYLTAVPGAAPVASLPDVDENIGAARHYALLAHYTGMPAFRAAAEHAMRFLATPAVVRSRLTDPGILLADDALAHDPTHLTVVGPHDSKDAAVLYQVALRQPGAYKRVEWWDRRKGPLPNQDVEYPLIDRAAGYVCANGRCSLPSFEPQAYVQQIERLLGSPGTAP